MVRVRLSRGGGKKRPYYHIVVVDQKSKRDGKCIERIGSYDPNLENERRITLKQDRLDYWINLGAQMSERVKLLRKYTQDPDNLEKRQKVKSSLLEKNKARRLKAKEAEAARRSRSSTCRRKSRSSTCRRKSRSSTCRRKSRSSTCRRKSRSSTCRRKSRSSTCRRKSRSSTCRRKSRYRSTRKKLNLLILGLFHEKRLYCYHRKDTSHTWH